MVDVSPVAEPPSPRPSPLDNAVDVAVAVLPTLTTVALYLPSGLLMPARLVTLALAAAALLVILRGRGGSRTSAVTGGVLGLMALFGGLGVLRYPARIQWADAAQTAFLMVLVLALAILTTRQRTVLALVGGWLMAGLVALPPGLWEVVTGRYMPKNGPAAEYGPLPGLGTASWFDNPNLFAYQIVVVLLLVPSVVAFIGRRWQAWLLVPFVGALLVLLSNAGAELATLSLLVGLLIWALRFGWVRRAVPAATVLGVLLILVVPTVNAFVSRQVAAVVTQAGEYGTSAWKRVRLYETGMWILQQTSWLGTGPGGFGSWAAQADNPYFAQAFVNPHWGLVEVMSEYGIVPLVALLVALLAAAVLAFRAAARGWLQPPARALAYAGGVLALTLPVLCMAHSSWLSQPLTALHLATIAGLARFAEASLSPGPRPSA